MPPWLRVLRHDSLVEGPSPRRSREPRSDGGAGRDRSGEGVQLDLGTPVAEGYRAERKEAQQSPEVSGFFDDLDPEIKCQVLAFRHPQIVAHLSTVTVPKNGRIKRDRGREVFKVTAITVCVARYLCEHEIVR